jgi:UDPglucose 6-dehydrogenase
MLALSLILGGAVLQKQKITVIGTGYVGLVTAACLASVGHDIMGLDKDESKIRLLKQGRSPIYEAGLESLIKQSLSKNLFFTGDYEEAITFGDVIFLAVGTPSAEDGNADLTALWSAVESLAMHVTQRKVIVVKSTVPVGTCEKVEERLKGLLGERYIDRDADALVSVVSNPEFLREGRSVDDFLHGDRVVIGGKDLDAIMRVSELYSPLGIPVVTCDFRSAELVKYASNAFLATKISFINSIARLCDVLGADVTKVSEGMGYDHRIMPGHLYAGLGYGGSCFPKDVSALLEVGKDAGVHLDLVEQTIRINNGQIDWALDKLRDSLGDLSGKRICLLGVAFKPNTDDMRDAPSVKLAQRLLLEEAEVTAYDPVARIEPIVPEVEQFDDVYDALTSADAALLVTEWEEFGQLDFERVMSVMKQPKLVDGRNFLRSEHLLGMGFEYKDLGRTTRLVR